MSKDFFRRSRSASPAAGTQGSSPSSHRMSHEGAVEDDRPADHDPRPQADGDPRDHDETDDDIDELEDDEICDNCGQLITFCRCQEAEFRS